VSTHQTAKQKNYKSRAPLQIFQFQDRYDQLQKRNLEDKWVQEQQQIQEELQALRSGLWSTPATPDEPSIQRGRKNDNISVSSNSNSQVRVEESPKNHDVSTIFNIVRTIFIKIKNKKIFFIASTICSNVSESQLYPGSMD
jgi:hypothetical protein